MAVTHGPCLLTEKKDPGLRKQVHEETSPNLLLGAQDQRLGAENYPVGPQEPLLATVKRGKLALFGHVTPTTASPKPSFRAPWGVGRRRGRQRKYLMDNVKEWTSLFMPELLTMASRRKKKSGRGSLLNRLSCPPDDQIGHGTETELTGTPK